MFQQPNVCVSAKCSGPQTLPSVPRQALDNVTPYVHGLGVSHCWKESNQRSEQASAQHRLLLTANAYGRRNSAHSR